MSDREATRRLLLDEHYQVVEIEDGDATVRAVLDGPAVPDCLLLGARLPDQDAVAVLRALTRPDGLVACPVVVTGVSRRDVGRAVLRAGAQDYLDETLRTPERLMRAIENAIERWQVTRTLAAAPRARTLVHRRRRTSLTDPLPFAPADLNAGEEGLRLALEASDTGLWTWDLRNDAVTWSRECYSIAGLGEGEFAGTGADFFLLVHEEDRARVEATVRQAIETRRLYESEFRIVRPTGELVWVANRGRGQYDDAGTPIGIVGTITDITERSRAEALLRRNRDTFASLIENDPFGVYVVDADFTLWQVSQGARKVFSGVRPLLGRDFAEVIRILWPEPFATEVIGRFRHTLATGEGYRSPATVERRADTAEEEAYDWRIDQISLPDGRPGVVCYFYDLSERQRLEAELRQSESFHRQTLESIPGMVFTNTPDGSCDYVSEQWVAFTGVPANEQLDDGWVKVLHPDDRERAFAAWRAAVEGRGEYDVQYRVRRADGEYKWFQVRGRAIRDHEGAIARWFGAAVNIDDLKQSESVRARRERELQSLADNIPDILTRFDGDLRHVFVNAAVETATGRPPADFLGRTNHELGMPADLCELWDEALRFAFDHRVPKSLEFAFIGPAGERHYTARLIPELGPRGEVATVLGVTHDVTDHRRFEHTLAERDKRKEEFLATLAHELRTPLAPIRTGLSILQLIETPVDSEFGRAVAVMERQFGHLVRLVDDLLDVSRVSQGKITLKREAVGVREAITAAVEASRQMIDAKGHTLTLDLPDASVVVDADATRLVQIVSNLLTNAAKYSEPGSRIAVEARREDAHAVIVVRDAGVGIAPSLLPTIWNLFTQVRDTLDKAQGGLGIGLSLVKKLVEMHGGTVTAESAGIDRGSTFTVRLPLAECASAEAPLAGRESSRPAPRRVLVVDDNVDGAELLAMLLQHSGHETATAHSGTHALEMVSAFAPEVVILDIGLPGMDGYEVARRLRSDPLAAQTTLVALTGWGSEDDKRRSREAGFDHHLTKPVGPEQVERVLAEIGSGGHAR